MSDITIKVNNVYVNLRVGALIYHNGMILLCRLQKHEWWFLPGGRIKTNESSTTALQRELQEEIGTDFQIIRPAICSENFFELNGRSFHELCTYYEVQWFGGTDLPQQAEEIFMWVDPKHLAPIDLRPAFLKNHIVNPTQSLELIIYRDGE